MNSKIQLSIIIFVLLAICIGCQLKKKGNNEINQGDTVDVQGMSDQVSDNSLSITFKMKLWERGIDFYARGNEPSWAVDIDFDGGMKFTTLAGLTIETTSYQINKSQDTNILRISDISESEEIIISISEQECNDTMSDEKFKYSVDVKIKKGDDDEYTSYNGCGQYVPDYRLHDIWVLNKVNGEEILGDRFPEKGPPLFEFFVEESIIRGHAGCNNFNGGFYRTGIDILHFEQFAMTRMMCPDMELEDLIAKSVAGRRMKYKIRDMKLILTGYDDTKLEFKKVD